MTTKEVFNTLPRRYPEFKGDVALITGSSRGIGKGVALRLAHEGMKVVIHGKDDDEVAGTVQEMRGSGIEAIGFAKDLTSDTAIEALFADIHRHFGGLDLLVNNAADLRRKTFEAENRDLLDYQLALNLRAPYLCSWQAAVLMREGRGGNIINISSVGGTQAHWRGLPYDVTKGGIDAMTRAMALELAADGIRVNAIAPGAIATEKTPSPDHDIIQAVSARIPLKRFGTPSDIGAMVAFLASDDASYITGQIMYVDGGITTQISPPGQPI